ncbi:ATP-dependent endonuclease [Bradyrhizobium liaoningense]|uniref:ATP-dependent nuclease n=1 Tax=Bradyrhizobium liaoningense TaxID=43992 RepID=UPI001BABA755|nr:AAA family ATPase [Bradyrhizobium liaoningense]MBR0908004.1 AAA family ATPase [Bradyrhizobium liaoningense]
MNETLRITEPEQKNPIVKPKLSFASAMFSNGDVLAFEEDEIVVFVGPNNAGKSAALRELEQFVSRNVAQKVITSVELRREGSHAELHDYLLKNAMTVGQTGQHSFAGMGYSIHHAHVKLFDQPKDRSPVAGFFCTRLSTETRLTGSNPANAIALFAEPPSHPIHLLLMDDVLTAKVSRLFRHAFGTDLIPFRAGGGSFPLYVGDKPVVAPGEDELSRSFIDRLRANAVPLHEQGDGMRSFASVLLYVLASDHHSIQFLDEPEAFLHPPQARLIGEFIARERTSKSQLFIATHSTDILDGLISGGAEKVRIIRIQRDGAVNRVKELSKTKTAAIVNDTLARYSRVFDGIFYQHVVICEADADCLFYSSILNTKAISGDRRADVLFIHTSGKHRMAQLAETLRQLDVPVSVIADIDLFKEENTCKQLFETMGGHWSDVSNNFKALKTAVEQRRPPMNAEQVTGLLRDKLNDVGGTGDFPKSKEREIKAVFKGISPWDDVKRAGRSAVPAGQAIRHYDDLLAKAAAIGLWIVPVGEIEGFCRSIEGGHGPGFVAKVLEERNLETDPELKDAREFVSMIWARARPIDATEKKEQEGQEEQAPAAGPS